MAFRADEAARVGLEEVEQYLVRRSTFPDPSQRAEIREALYEAVKHLGPAIRTYPSWHPLVCNHDDEHPEWLPSSGSGYSGLDHTQHFAHGFITCPYTASGKADEVIESVDALPPHPVATITAQKLDIKLYHPEATPVLVRCDWNETLEPEGTIPLRIALPLMLEKEVPGWRWASCAETWETMRPYLLGAPYGSRSSLFVSQETGQAIKKIWMSLIQSGMFGPIKER